MKKRTRRRDLKLSADHLTLYGSGMVLHTDMEGVEDAIRLIRLMKKFIVECMS